MGVPDPIRRLARPVRSPASYRPAHADIFRHMTLFTSNTTLSSAEQATYQALLIHEAGHAVMACHFGYPLEYVAYQSYNQATTQTGEVRFEKFQGPARAAAKDQYLKVVVAGVAAELAINNRVAVDQFRMSLADLHPMDDLSRFLYAQVKDLSAYQPDSTAVQTFLTSNYQSRQTYKPDWDAQVQACVDLFTGPLSRPLKAVIQLLDSTFLGQKNLQRVIGVDAPDIQKLVP